MEIRNRLWEKFNCMMFVRIVWRTYFVFHFFMWIYSLFIHRLWYIVLSLRNIGEEERKPDWKLSRIQPPVFGKWFSCCARAANGSVFHASELDEWFCCTFINALVSTPLGFIHRDKKFRCWGWCGGIRMCVCCMANWWNKPTYAIYSYMFVYPSTSS